jgi:transcription termination factor Rho
MDRSTLQRKSVDDLREIAKQLDLTGVGRLRKADLIDTIIGEIDDTDDEDDADDGDDGDDEGGSDEQSRRRDEVIERRRSRNRNRDADGDDGDGSDGNADDGDGGNADDGGDGNGRDERDEDDDDGTGSSNGRARARSRDRRKRTKGRGGELEGLEEREGVLDLLPEGYGFLRTTGYVSGPRDVYVSQSYVRRFNLRRGDLLGGPVRFNKGNDKFPALARLETCEGEVVDNEHDPLLRDRPDFGDLDVVFPEERLRLGDSGSPVLRAVDAFAPIGFGQRALLLTPPTADAGAVVRAVTAAIAEQEPDVELFVALIDARPRRSPSASGRSTPRSWAHRSMRRPRTTSRRPSSSWSGPSGSRSAVRTSWWCSTPCRSWVAPTTWLARPPVGRCRVGWTPGPSPRSSSCSAVRGTSTVTAHSRCWPSPGSTPTPRPIGPSSTTFVARATHSCASTPRWAWTATSPPSTCSGPVPGGPRRWSARTMPARRPRPDAPWPDSTAVLPGP